ncbi:MAG: hypothetical protein F6K11_01195 [Leptolyngbya sp. SIO3F4]|nr:hypothetical protein [Leptolyngbya sp. SIO3F4]
MLVRLFAPLGVAGLTGPIIGKLEIGKQPIHGLGLFALIVVTLYMNPAAWARSADCDTERLLSGRILLGEAPLKEARILLPRSGNQTISDARGHFLLRLPETDSGIILRVHYRWMDTIVHLEAGRQEVDIRFPDTLRQLTTPTIEDVLHPLYSRYAAEVESHWNSWQARAEQRETTLKRLVLLYDQPLLCHALGYRNEYSYQTPLQRLNYRKNLLAAGIYQVDPQEPYGAHHFTDYTTCLLAYYNEPDGYLLEYAMRNALPPQPRVLRMEPSGSGRYMVRVRYQEPVRALNVRIECSERTGWLRKRTMKFYGMYPEQVYALVFRNDRWILKDQS